MLPAAAATAEKQIENLKAARNTNKSNRGDDGRIYLAWQRINIRCAHLIFTEVFHGSALFFCLGSLLLLRLYHFVNCRKAGSSSRENARGFGIFVPMHVYLRRLLLHCQLTHVAMHL